MALPERHRLGLESTMEIKHYQINYYLFYSTFSCMVQRLALSLAIIYCAEGAYPACTNVRLSPHVEIPTFPLLSCLSCFFCNSAKRLKPNEPHFGPGPGLVLVVLNRILRNSTFFFSMTVMFVCVHVCNVFLADTQHRERKQEFRGKKIQRNRL